GFREIRRVSPPLYAAFDAVRKEHGLSLLEVYTRGREHEDLYQLAELLTDWDEQIGVWRFRHVKMVGRDSGEDLVGTEGTPVALSAVRAASRDELAGGVVTASAGNMAQGVAWAAREAGVRAWVVAPEDAPRAKLDAVERLGGKIVPVSHEAWWQAMVDRRYEGL